MKRAKQQAARSDNRSTAKIEGAGWTIIQRRASYAPRFVALKQRIEEDHSVTKLYESSLTLAGLAKNVERREREESRPTRPEA